MDDAESRAEASEQATASDRPSFLQTQFFRLFEDPHEGSEQLPIQVSSMSYGSAEGTESSSTQEDMKDVLVAEFVGSFFYIFASGCTFATLAIPTWGATAMAFCLMAMVYLFAPISGAHLNPALSLTLVLSRDMPVEKFWKYSCAQLSAGLVAGWMCRLVCSPNLVEIKAKDPFWWLDACLLELIYSCLLCFVFLNCTISKRNTPNNFFGLAIGFVMVAAGYSAGGVTGALLNPSASLGLGIASGKPVGHAFLFAATEMLSAFPAWYLYLGVRAHEFKAESGLFLSATLPQRLLAECLGTFVLMVTLGVNLLVGSRSLPFSVAAALMVMTYSLVNVSGSHFNPAVTLAAWLSGNGKLSNSDSTNYVAVQAGAAILGGLFTGYLGYEDPSSNGPLKLGAGDGWQLWQATLAELMFTWLLAYVTLVFSLPVESGSISEQNPLFGLIVSSCVTAGGFSVGVISGGLFNPALCLGMAIHSCVHRVPGETSSWNAFPSFVSAQILGSFFAAGLFSQTHKKKIREETPLEAAYDEGPTVEEAPDASVISSEEAPEAAPERAPELRRGSRDRASQV